MGTNDRKEKSESVKTDGISNKLRKKLKQFLAGKGALVQDIIKGGSGSWIFKRFFNFFFPQWGLNQDLTSSIPLLVAKEISYYVMSAYIQSIFLRIILTILANVFPGLDTIAMFIFPIVAYQISKKILNNVKFVGVRQFRNVKKC